jgi:hypothetical protein
MWQPHTPAMAAGLTDRVWTLREVLIFVRLASLRPLGFSAACFSGSSALLAFGKTLRR